MLAGRKSLRRPGFGRGLLRLISTWGVLPDGPLPIRFSGLSEVALSHHHQNLAPPQAPPPG